MKAERLIPYYAPDGTSLGFRTLEAAKRLIEGRYVKPSWGRKGHLRAIWLLSPDGGNPIQTRAPQGTKYSVIEKLQHGRCWKLRKLDGCDEDGVPFSARNVFLQVVAECMVG
ncbi:MAG: hypothetical protein ABSE21_08055 [Bryobacteraceae bacterium]|jgi:hypothetical protein